MSADNYIVVRKFNDGWYWGMGFASDQYEDDRLPDSQFRNGPFKSSEVAANHAEGDKRCRPT